MKNIYLAALVLVLSSVSTVSFASQTHKLKRVVISFDEKDVKTRLPASAD